MTAHITPTDLHVLDAEPRVQDLRLAEVLEFTKPENIRQLVKRNTEELAKYGEVFCAAQRTTPNGGRPGVEYWLNEAQSVLICMFSRTDKAAEARHEIINVFLAWRRGHAPPALPGPIPSTGDTIDGVPLGVITAKLGMVRESRLIHGPDRARLLWDRLGLPAVPGGNEIAVAEAREAVRHLLATTIPAGEGGYTIGRRIEIALDDNPDFDGGLRELGIRVIGGDDPGFVVANVFTPIEDIFRGTRWQRSAWRQALRHYPGARRSKVMKFGGNRAACGTFIPADALDDH